MKVRQKAYSLYLKIFRMTGYFPKEKIYGLVSRMKQQKSKGFLSFDKSGRKQTLESSNR
ncbi:MAG: four helix bundle protein [Deltaproteobacteria bacterium]|nr:four helix bundle protein [Deltaproteobacteria bacterium]